MTTRATRVQAAVALALVATAVACGTITGLDDVPVTYDTTAGADASADVAKVPKDTGTDSAPETEPEPTCTKIGAGPCDSPTSCCPNDNPRASDLAFTCFESKCQLCTLTGSVRQSGTSCCNGQFIDVGKTCPKSCVGVGGQCGANADCCDPDAGAARFQCDKGKCATCLTEGTTCAPGQLCCGAGIVCRTGACRECLPKSATGCEKNEDCCAGLVCATDVEAPDTKRCVEKCWPEWSFSNVATPCKNAAAGFENRPCCAPFKCNFPIPASSATGCGR